MTMQRHTVQVAFDGRLGKGTIAQAVDVHPNRPELGILRHGQATVQWDERHEHVRACPVAPASTARLAGGCGGGAPPVLRWGRVWIGRPYPERWTLQVAGRVVLRGCWVADAAWWAWASGGGRCAGFVGRSMVRAARTARRPVRWSWAAWRWSWARLGVRVVVEQHDGCGCDLWARTLTKGARQAGAELLRRAADTTSRARRVAERSAR